MNAWQPLRQQDRAHCGEADMQLQGRCQLLMQRECLGSGRVNFVQAGHASDGRSQLLQGTIMDGQHVIRAPPLALKRPQRVQSQLMGRQMVAES